MIPPHGAEARTGGVARAVWFVPNIGHRAGPYVLIEVVRGETEIPPGVATGGRV